MKEIVEFSKDEIKQCFDFATKMKGKHKPHFVGKEVVEKRDDREIFINDFQGKISEIAFKKYLLQKYPKNKINVYEDIDWGIYERGKWDNCDLKINNSYISIKSSKCNSVVLMIESDRFDSNGESSYRNSDGSLIQTDFYIFIGIDIYPFISWNDIKGDFNNFITYSSDLNRKIHAEIYGMISHKDFWNKKKFIPRGTVISVKNMNDYLLKNTPLNNLPDKKGVTMIANNYAVHKNYLSNF